MAHQRRSSSWRALAFAWACTAALFLLPAIGAMAQPQRSSSCAVFDPTRDVPKVQHPGGFVNRDYFLHLFLYNSVSTKPVPKADSLLERFIIATTKKRPVRQEVKAIDERLRFVQQLTSFKMATKVSADAALESIDALIAACNRWLKIKGGKKNEREPGVQALLDAAFLFKAKWAPVRCTVRYARPAKSAKPYVECLLGLPGLGGQITDRQVPVESRWPALMNEYIEGGVKQAIEYQNPITLNKGAVNPNFLQDLDFTVTCDLSSIIFARRNCKRQSDLKNRIKAGRKAVFACKPLVQSRVVNEIYLDSRKEAGAALDQALVVEPAEDDVSLAVRVLKTFRAQSKTFWKLPKDGADLPEKFTQARIALLGKRFGVAKSKYLTGWLAADAMVREMVANKTINMLDLAAIKQINKLLRPGDALGGLVRGSAEFANLPVSKSEKEVVSPAKNGTEKGAAGKDSEKPGKSGMDKEVAGKNGKSTDAKDETTGKDLTKNGKSTDAKTSATGKDAAKDTSKDKTTDPKPSGKDAAKDEKDTKGSKPAPSPKANPPPTKDTKSSGSGSGSTSSGGSTSTGKGSSGSSSGSTSGSSKDSTTGSGKASSGTTGSSTAGSTSKSGGTSSGSNKSPSKPSLFRRTHTDKTGVTARLDKFLAWLTDVSDDTDAISLITAGRAYAWLVSINPFGDANEETARLVADYILMKDKLAPAIWEGDFAVSGASLLARETDSSTWFSKVVMQTLAAEKMALVALGANDIPNLLQRTQQKSGGGGRMGQFLDEEETLEDEEDGDEDDGGMPAPLVEKPKAGEEQVGKGEMDAEKPGKAEKAEKSEKGEVEGEKPADQG